jgi:leader peptidase (prepilin peptidase)/N-methyltransferase
MGGGDIKLLAMIGAFLGWQSIFVTLFVGSVIGSIIGVVVMLYEGADTKLAIPFGPFLAGGALVYLFWGDRILAFYFGV